MLEVRLLGRFEIRHGQKTVEITSRPAQTLFAFLVLNAGTAYRREKLSGQLWPDSTEESARDHLRHALWRIRKALEPAAASGYLKTDDLTISFDDNKEHWLDAAALPALRSAASAEELAEAVDCYTGELLPGFYDEWVVLEREHLLSMYEQHAARLLDILQQESRWADVLKYAEKWIALGQRPEAAFRHLISAYAAQGDMAKAAAAYERCAKSLAELGVEPSEQTRRLYEDIKTRRTPGQISLRQKPPAARPRSTPNLPAPLTSFIGREKELRHIAKLLQTSRLVTLTGPGGVGKTRLAIQAASDSSKKFKDGVFWVGLVGLSDENLIPQAVAQSLQVLEVAHEPLIETLKGHLKARELLLVLDNCEHLIRGCAQFTEQLLEACTQLRILATSIEGLGLFNETVWQVPSLPSPERQQLLSLKQLREYESIRLFEERAVSANARFALTEQNAKAVSQICQRLDGIPLAIELAAARMRVLSVDEIAARLDDRFSLLSAGSRTAIPRHQTLRATIDWSHELLSQSERTLFRRLAVFAGGFTLEAVEAVGSLGESKPGKILDLLARLVDKSLVIVEPAVEGGETRYRLLETIRQYALERLVEAAEAPEIRRRHAVFYLQLAEQSEPNIFGSESVVWFHRLERELDNIRSAIEWSTASGDAALALRILGSLVYFWFARGHLGFEWNDRVQQALERPEGKQRTLVRAKALNGIGFMYWADIYPTDKRAEIEEALAIGRELEDPWNIATALRNLGILEVIQGNYGAARSVLEQSLETWRQMGPEGRMGAANTLIFLGEAAFSEGQAEQARAFYEEAALMLREPGDLNFLAMTVRRLGQLALQAGDLGKAFACFKESLQLNREVGDPRGILACLAAFSAIAIARGEYDRAAILAGFVENQVASVGIRLLYTDRLEYERNMIGLRAALDPGTVTKLWAKGKAFSLDEAIAFALEDA